jgi:hypothetical protein
VERREDLSARYFTTSTGAGSQSDETVGGAADDPLVELRVAHEPDDEEVRSDLF